MTTIANLDELCPFDQRPIGDHTLREWDEHAARRHTDLPYEEVPDGPIMSSIDGATIADTYTARATVMYGQAGGAKIVVPCLILDFAVGIPAGAPLPVASVALIAPPDTMRKAGKLFRDSAYDAANAAERTAAP